MPIILSPAGGSSTTNRSVTIIGTAEENTVISVYSTDGLTLLTTVPVDEDGNWTAITPELALGGHWLLIRDTDAAGNTNPVAAGLIITITSTSTATNGSTGGGT